MSARAHWSPFMPMLTQLVDQLGFDQVMTSHPKAIREGEIMAHRLGLGWTADSTTFFRDVDVLVCDNSSLMFEMAALGRRVVALNAPWYRRDVTHGLRFWSHIPGPDVDDVDTLARTLQRIADRDSIMLDCGRLAARAARAAYGVLDGSSSTRAADAIMDLYD
jgi:glycosyltransferase involved in cell wall biosynthesis